MDLIRKFCKIAVALFEYAKEEAGEDESFPNDEEVTLSFEHEGKKYNVCITASEVKDGEQNDN